MFLVETGFHHDGQAGLEFLTSGDLPSSASQSARITGVSHHSQPFFFSFFFFKDGNWWHFLTIRSNVYLFLPYPERTPACAGHWDCSASDMRPHCPGGSQVKKEISLYHETLCVHLRCKPGLSATVDISSIQDIGKSPSQGNIVRPHLYRKIQNN